MTRTRASALCIGSRAQISSAAPATATSAHTKKMMTGKFIRASPVPQMRPNDHESRNHQIRERDRQQELPAERHQLVIAESRQGGAHPDVEEQDRQDFCSEPEWSLYAFGYRRIEADQSAAACEQGDDAEPEACDPAHFSDGVPRAVRREREQADRGKVNLPVPAVGKRREPATEEQNRSEAGDRDHIRVFGHEKHRKLKRRILGVESGDQLGFGFRQIVRDAVGFGDSGGQIAEKPDDLRENIPFWNEMQPVAGLAGRTVRNSADDFVEIESSGEKYHSHYGNRERNFIADHLRRAAQAAEERVFAVGGPSGQRDAVDAHRRNREQEKQSDIQINDRKNLLSVRKQNRRRAERNESDGR